MRTSIKADSGESRDGFGGIECKTTRTKKKAIIVGLEYVKNNKSEEKKESSCFCICGQYFQFEGNCGSGVIWKHDT